MVGAFAINATWNVEKKERDSRRIFHKCIFGSPRGILANTVFILSSPTVCDMSDISYSPTLQTNALTHFAFETTKHEETLLPSLSATPE